MIANAAVVEQHLRDSLPGKSGIAAIHGKGCLLGIEFDEPCGPVHKKLLENKIITGTSSDPKVLRLLPPLCVRTDEIDRLIEVLS
jgi:acetylornithine/succinyldiaminopimelate/putrescine aminotransferase